MYIALIKIFFNPAKSALCAQTTATPEHNKTTVFTKGSIKGFNTSKSLIPTGGQIPLL
jgi:hypothetical protein